MTNPIVPNDNDILCGKSRECLAAPGSVKFRTFIDTYTDRYCAASTKYAKMTITKEIYEKVSLESRFLKFNEEENLWEEISVMAGRDKIGHALRFSARATRRHGKKSHRRTGSLSSISSTDSNSNHFSWDCINLEGLDQVLPEQRGRLHSSGSCVTSSSNSQSTAMAKPPLPHSSKSKLSREATLTSDELDAFIKEVAGSSSKLELCDFPNAGLHNDVVEVGLSSLVENLELEHQQITHPVAETDKDDALSSFLLNEPLGDFGVIDDDDIPEGGEPSSRSIFV